MSYPVADIQIKSPHQLTTFLREIKAALADGALTQFVPTDAVLALDDLGVISDAGPWPDYIEAYFTSPITGERYKLTAETYHGVGGSWQRL